MVHDTEPVGRGAKGFHDPTGRNGRQGPRFRPVSPGLLHGSRRAEAPEGPDDVFHDRCPQGPSLAFAPDDASAIKAGTSRAVALCKSVASLRLPTTANTTGPHELCPTPFTPIPRSRNTRSDTAKLAYRPPCAGENASPARALNSYKESPNASRSAAASAGSIPVSTIRHRASVSAGDGPPSANLANASRSRTPYQAVSRGGVYTSTLQSAGNGSRATSGEMASSGCFPPSTISPPWSNP